MGPEEDLSRVSPAPQSSWLLPAVLPPTLPRPLLQPSPPRSDLRLPPCTDRRSRVQALHSSVAERLPQVAPGWRVERCSSPAEALFWVRPGARARPRQPRWHLLPTGDMYWRSARSLRHFARQFSSTAIMTCAQCPPSMQGLAEGLSNSRQSQSRSGSPYPARGTTRMGKTAPKKACPQRTCSRQSTERSKSCASAGMTSLLPWERRIRGFLCSHGQRDEPMPNAVSQ